MLQQRGSDIVDEDGRRVMLRGIGLGGWMNMENFITGYPGNEAGWRAALRHELGEEKYELFFDRFLEHFFGEDDARYLHSLGLNLVRLPVNYRHFESDLEPFVIKEEGFKHLDCVVDLCARHGIYTIIDLHAVQGYQNQDWHSDNPTHKPFLWENKHFQDRATHLWEVIADRYRGNRWVAGYNLMNEPYDPSGEMIVSVTRRLYDTVRAADPDHLVFVDGNRYASSFSDFSEPWPGVVYSPHDYALCGMSEGGPYPGYTGTVWCDKQFLEKHFLRKSAFMRDHQVPTWVGEFGPVYCGNPEVDAMRYQVARDQIEIFERYGAHWAIWTYKDIGLQGLVYTASNSPWIERMRPTLAKKARLGVDGWGSRGTEIPEVMGPLDELFTREFPNRTALPFAPRWMSGRLVRSVLLAEALVPECAARFRGITENEIEELMGSFSFENCIRRTELADVLGHGIACL